MAEAIAETWFQSYARTVVLKVLGRIQRGRLTVISKYRGNNGDPEVFGGMNTKEGNSDWDITVVFNTPNAWLRLCQAFDLGFSEAYMLQEIDCDDLVGLFSLYIANRANLGFAGGTMLHRLVPHLSHLIFSPTNDITHAKLHASFHYDTSNIMFSSFLSADMNYSTAIWSGESGETLESAQLRKVHNIINKARISSSDHVLDIGCGWGHLAMEAVKKTGCRVTGVTLSAEQKQLAEKRIKDAGLEDKISILLCDYRQVPKPEGGYDRVVSVEMLEHVGDKFMNEYFSSISHLLKEKNGIMVIQGITFINPIHNNRPTVSTFIDRYVFPGGYLPSVNQILSSIHTGSQGTLEIETVQSIGPHYAKTLKCWRENFIHNWDIIKAGFEADNKDATEASIEAFRRRWVYYFMYCESGFRSRIIDDYVISAVRTPKEVVDSESVFE